MGLLISPKNPGVMGRCARIVPAVVFSHPVGGSKAAETASAWSTRGYTRAGNAVFAGDARALDAKNIAQAIIEKRAMMDPA